MLETARREFEDERGRMADDLKDTKKEFQDLKRTYDDFMALKAPVKYWTTRQKTHKKRAQLFGIWFAVWSVAGLVATIAFARVWMNADRPPNWTLGFAALGITLFLWVARVLSRSLMTTMHLELDASERAVMTETYLALSKEGKVAEDDRTMIVSSLFRHSPIGLLKDDAGPNTPLDLLSRLLSK